MIRILVGSILKWKGAFSAFLCFAAIVLGGLMIYAFFRILRFYRNFTIHPEKYVEQYFMDEFLKLVDSKEAEAALETLEKACNVTGQNCSLWAGLAYYYEARLHNHDKADEIMSKAEIVSESKPVDKEEMAAYEYWVGLFLISRGQETIGLEHLKRSVELGPTQGRIETYNRIRQDFA
jgi:hypothetical protein